MLRSLSDQWVFAREFCRTKRSIGAIAPSSRHLAHALMRPLKEHVGSCRIIEVGAGTGAITKHIARALRPGDVLHAVEINEKFVQFLRKRLDTDPRLSRVKSQVEVIHAPIQDVDASQPYDYIISGLPFNSFEVPFVESIFDHYRKLLKPDGVLAFFEYRWIREVSSLVITPEERRRIAQVGKRLSEYLRNHEFKRQTVFANVPPALVHYLRFQDSSPILPITTDVATAQSSNVGT